MYTEHCTQLNQDTQIHKTVKENLPHLTIKEKVLYLQWLWIENSNTAEETHCSTRWEGLVVTSKFKTVSKPSLWDKATRADVKVTRVSDSDLKDKWQCVRKGWTEHSRTLKER